jgi:hypothetical protein
MFLKKNNTLIVRFLILVSLVVVAFSIYLYKRNNKIIKNLLSSQELMKKEIKLYEDISLETVTSLLVVHEVFDSKGPIKLIRHGKENDGGYVVPELALVKADALLGYGVADDISFEESFSEIYKKPSYGFDCGVDSIDIKNKLCTFIRQCITSDSFLYNNQKSSGSITSYSEQINKLGLEGKKVFVKMDIEGAEYEAFDDIFKHSRNITGIVLELHFLNAEQSLKAAKLLARLKNDFLLVHIHSNNCCAASFSNDKIKGSIARVIELSFINKSLIARSSISERQSFPLPIDMPNCIGKPQVEFEILR